MQPTKGYLVYKDINAIAFPLCSSSIILHTSASSQSSRNIGDSLDMYASNNGNEVMGTVGINIELTGNLYKVFIEFISNSSPTNNMLIIYNKMHFNVLLSLASNFIYNFPVFSLIAFKFFEFSCIMFSF